MTDISEIERRDILPNFVTWSYFANTFAVINVSNSVAQKTNNFGKSAHFFANSFDGNRSRPVSRKYDRLPKERFHFPADFCPLRKIIAEGFAEEKGAQEYSPQWNRRSCDNRQERGYVSAGTNIRFCKLTFEIAFKVLAIAFTVFFPSLLIAALGFIHDQDENL